MMGAQSHPENILIVEDDAVDLEAVQRCLRSSDLKLTVCNVGSVAGAATLADKKTFDVILLDLCLPDSVGPSTVSRLHALFPNAALIVLTGTRAEHVAEQSISLGAQDYISKDSLTSELVRKSILYAHQRSLLNRHLQCEADRAFAAAKANQIFLAKMSHEIRTPLNGIIGGIDLLLASAPEDTNTRDWLLTSIKSSSDVLLQTVNDVLDLARLEEGKLSLHKTDVPIWQLVENVLLTYAPMAKNKGLLLGGVFLVHPQATIQTDALRLTQVLNNLINNALKFTESGHVLVRFSVSKSGVPTIRIEDTGRGIDPSKFESIFDSFKQARDDRDASMGTGLGLAICKQIISVLGGSIRVFNNDHGGATFEVTLADRVREPGPIPATGFTTLSKKQFERMAPFGRELFLEQFSLFKNVAWKDSLLPDQSKSDLDHLTSLFLPSKLLIASLRHQTRSEQEVGDFESLNALVAEDNKTNRDIFGEMLSRLNIKHRMVNDGKAAIEAMRYGNFDIVFLDCRMPIVDGYTASRKIREMSLIKQPVIVAVTANTFEAEKAHCLDSGMDSVLTKPLTVCALTKELARWFPKVSLTAADKEGEKKVVTDAVETSMIEHLLAVTNSTDKLLSIVDSFRSSAGEEISHLRELILASDVEGARAILHSLKGSASALGAKCVSSSCARLENQYSGLTQTEFLGATEQVEHELQIYLKGVHQYLDVRSLS